MALSRWNLLRKLLTNSVVVASFVAARSVYELIGFRSFAEDCEAAVNKSNRECMEKDSCHIYLSSVYV